MKKAIILMVAVVLGVTNVAALQGSWRGELNVGVAKIPIVLNFTEKGKSTKCTLDSPSQGAYGLPAMVKHASADSIAVSAITIGASFSGHVGPEEITGQFAQNGHRFPLTLVRERPLIERRPQTPQPPFPYQEIDTTFRSTDGTILAGTLTLPDSYRPGKTPMCVFVTGSGPQNRDEELFEHRPFAVIADYLARNGVASFRYDDRGTAKSKGNYASSTIHTFADDARAAVNFAKAFSGGPTGIIGHSEGGTIALLLASDGVPDFIVTLAGMAVSGKETVMGQNKLLLQNTGFDNKTVNDSMALLDAVFDEIIRRNAACDSTPIDAEAMAEELGINLPAALMKSVKDNLAVSKGYFATLLAVDPRQGMSTIKCPVLALNGTLDTQVPASENLQAIRRGIKRATVVEFPGLNHLFQHATTGDISEYSQIPETISPEVLTQILTFLQSQKFK